MHELQRGQFGFILVVVAIVLVSSQSGCLLLLAPIRPFPNRALSIRHMLCNTLLIIIVMYDIGSAVIKFNIVYKSIISVEQG